MGDLRQCFRLLQAAEKIRVLRHHAEGLVIDGALQLCRVEEAVGGGQRLDVQVQVGDVGGEGMAVFGVNAFGDEDQQFLERAGGLIAHCLH